MPLPLPAAFRAKMKAPDPVDPNGEDDVEDPKTGKENPLKRWAALKAGGGPPTR